MKNIFTLLCIFTVSCSSIQRNHYKKDELPNHPEFLSKDKTFVLVIKEGDWQRYPTCMNDHLSEKNAKDIEKSLIGKKIKVIVLTSQVLEERHCLYRNY